MFHACMHYNYICTSAYDMMTKEKQILSVSVNQGYSFELYDGSHECLQCSHQLLYSEH